MNNNQRQSLKNHIKINNFKLKSNKDVVLDLMDCYPESPIYEEVVEEYVNLEKETRDLIEPVALIQFGKLKDSLKVEDYPTGTPSCYVFYTIGDKIKESSRNYFDEGNYLAGMIVNAIADDYLFQIGKELEKKLKIICKERSMGVIKRLDATVEVPMVAQEVVLKETKADRILNMGVTEGYMFTTVKSNCFILILSDNPDIINIKHDCSKCDLINCKLRNMQEESTKEVIIQVVRDNKKVKINCKEKENLLEALLRQGFYMSAACGGKGTCGKCKIKVTSGDLKVTIQDEKTLKKEELEKGYRLACRAYPSQDCTVELLSGDESDFEVVTDSSNEVNNQIKASEEDYGFAVDIGTTTIAISLVELDSKKNLKTYTAVNKQRAYGADVISRIEASNSGKNHLLQNSIRMDLIKGFMHLLTEAGLEKKYIKVIAISGNTTMGHLLMGYSCKTLGIYPFTPVNISTIESNYQDVFGSDEFDALVTLLPGVSTFVGADVIAGLTVSGFDKKEAPCMLIDLGTNGEMAIGTKDQILVSSTAAGPAFEGGNITYGVGSIKGAICNISVNSDSGNNSANTYSYKNVHSATIGDKSPVGICGTGVVEITSELISNEIVDENGLLVEPYFDNGFPIYKTNDVFEETDDNTIRFTQKDVREIQLAKAAIRAGMDTLILHYGISYDQLDTIYLAGGFGYKINIEKAAHIGLLPKELIGKVKAIGNGSLAGVVEYLLDEKGKERTKKIIANSKEIALSTDMDFNRMYVENMQFEV